MNLGHWAGAASPLGRGSAMVSAGIGVPSCAPLFEGPNINQAPGAHLGFPRAAGAAAATACGEPRR